MESLSGTVEDNNGFEGTPPLVELTPNTMQEVFLDVWPGSMDHCQRIWGGDLSVPTTPPNLQGTGDKGGDRPMCGFHQPERDSQEEGLAHYRVEDLLQHAGVDTQDLVPVDPQMVLNQDAWGQVEQQPVKQEDPVRSAYVGPPATNVYEGEYRFDVRCPNRAKSTKSVTWTYAEHWRKLYANMNTACPFHIFVDKAPPPGTMVRVMAVYAEAEDRMEVIKRCVVHADPENNQGDVVAPLSHFVRCDSPKAEYLEDPNSKRHSLIVRYEEPQAGLGYMQCLLRFMCLSSCASSMRRRAVQLIWTLENSGHVLGRQAIGLKVCACPGRDRNTEERAATRQRDCPSLDPAPLFEPPAVVPAVATTSRGQSVRRKRALVDAPSAFHGGPSKPRRVEPDEERSYNFKCSSREIFDTLKLMRDSLMALKVHKPALFRAHLKKLATHERGTTVKQEPGEAVSSGESQE
ncbi:cellular tumor antigen p53-like isoform X2 [Haemaphysalis longicornis]